jgi:hypothetical protein
MKKGLGLPLRAYLIGIHPVPENDSSSNTRVQQIIVPIIVALIGLVGVLAAAVIPNWDKIFGHGSVDGGKHEDWHFANFSPGNPGSVAFTMMPDGNIACASYDQNSCLWGTAIEDLKFSKLRPLECGEMHRAKYGKTGYDDPTHWCYLARKVYSTAH